MLCVMTFVSVVDEHALRPVVRELVSCKQTSKQTIKQAGKRAGDNDIVDIDKLIR